ncbi:MAG: hypothetical protein K0U66_02790, partial [Gammaproteobacteria bacterium]|nr:hypothetical protein [Gammaproteobacteria bacterium]
QTLVSVWVGGEVLHDGGVGGSGSDSGDSLAGRTGLAGWRSRGHIRGVRGVQTLVSVWVGGEVLHDGTSGAV